MYKELATLIGVCCLFLVPFQATAEDQKTIELELKSTADGRLFYVQLGLGQVASQGHKKSNLLVSSTYPMTWINSIRVDKERGYANSSVGTWRAGQTISPTGALYGGYNFLVHKETCQIGSSQMFIENQQIALAYPCEKATPLPAEYNIDGVLGLSGYDAIPKDANYLFKNLFHLGHISKLQFSLYINNDDNQNGGQQGGASSAGALVLGGVNEKYSTGEFKYAKLHQNEVKLTNNVVELSLLLHRIVQRTFAMNKSLIITKVELDWARVNLETRSRAELERVLTEDRVDLAEPEARLTLDSSLILYVGPSRVLDRIHEDFIPATKIGSPHFYVFADCHLDNKPDIVFTVDDLQFVVTPEDYVVHDQLDGRNVCLSAFLGSSSDNNWVFGTKFLRNYYTVFDFEKDQIGFATPAQMN